MVSVIFVFMNLPFVVDLLVGLIVVITKGSECLFECEAGEYGFGARLFRNSVAVAVRGDARLVQLVVDRNGRVGKN